MFKNTNLFNKLKKLNINANSFIFISSIIIFPIMLSNILNNNEIKQKKSDYELFKKYASKQNMADYNELEKLKANEFKNNTYYIELLELYENKYDRALDSIKYENKIH